MSDLATSLALVLAITGILFLIAEALSPGVFLIIPGTVLLILGIIGLVYPDILLSWWSPIIAAVILIPTTILTIKFYQRLAEPIPPTTTVSSSLIGRTGVVTVKIMPGTLRGKVRVSNDIWSATSDQEIEVGEKVRIIDSEGVHIKVIPIGTEDTRNEC
ncbi:MAG: inner membrane protein [Candidatus Methanomethylophilaceae archaeon]|nr:inner membrane protein [Candidatus Methanomethylophilaceae archaeon]MDI3541994.1 inner membrane protein [Candidatus Methanomethylophilaceae archaeon]HIJ00469.1 NfeD family protein [Candidatus Methanomethylophilaceae archaeon]